jgi:hypothetical protein
MYNVKSVKMMINVLHSVHVIHACVLTSWSFLCLRFFRGILPTEAEPTRFGTDALLDPPVGLNTARENIFIGINNISATTEQHYSKYRTYISNLSQKPTLRQDTILLPVSATPQYHQNAVHAHEVIAMDKVCVLSVQSNYCPVRIITNCRNNSEDRANILIYLSHAQVMILWK